MVPLSHCLDYKGRLTELQLLPLMYYYDLQDLLFLIKCLLSPPDNFNILQYISFSSHGTRSTTAGKLKVNYRRTSTTRHFYFNRVVKLWNAVPPSCLDLTFTYNTIRRRLLLHFWDHFLSHFSSDSPCSFHYVCPCSSCHIQWSLIIYLPIINSHLFDCSFFYCFGCNTCGCSPSVFHGNPAFLYTCLHLFYTVKFLIIIITVIKTIEVYLTRPRFFTQVDLPKKTSLPCTAKDQVHPVSYM